MLVPNRKSVKQTDLKSVTAGAMLKHRYDFNIGILRSFVRYSQQVESQTKAEVMTAVDALASTMIAQYQFGSQFMEDIHKYINTMYVKSHSSVLSEMLDDVVVPTEVFHSMKDTLCTSPDSAKLFAGFSPRFRSVLIQNI